MPQIRATTGWLLRRPMAPRTPMTVPSTVAMKASWRVSTAPSKKAGHRSRIVAKSRLRFIVGDPALGRSLVRHPVVDPEQSLVAVHAFTMGARLDILARHQRRARQWN